VLGRAPDARLVWPAPHVGPGPGCAATGS